MALVGDGEGGLGTVGVPCDGYPGRIDQPIEMTSPALICSKQAADHEAHVAGLIRQIPLVRAARRVGILDREYRRRDDITGSRPGVEQTRVVAWQEPEPVTEHDQRKRRPSRGGVADVGKERPRSTCPGSEPRDPASVHEVENTEPNPRA